MRPIDFCTPKPFQLEHSCSVVSRRSDRPRPTRFFRCALFEGRSRPGALRLRARSRERLCRALPHPSEDLRGRHRSARGLPMRTRPGRISLHGRIPTSATGRCSRGGVFFRRVKSNRPPLAPLSPPPCRSPGFAFLRIQTVARRPPRPVPRGPRERRALCRSRVPSAGSCHTHPARAEARTKPRSLLRRRGAHVMRIAELRGSAPLLPPVGSCACAPERPPMVRLPFTRSYAATRLSTQSSQVARFSEPEGVLPTSAIRRCTGTDRELLRSSCCRER